MTPSKYNNSAATEWQKKKGKKKYVFWGPCLKRERRRKVSELIQTRDRIGFSVKLIQTGGGGHEERVVWKGGEEKRGRGSGHQAGKKGPES